MKNLLTFTLFLFFSISSICQNTSPLPADTAKGNLILVNKTHYLPKDFVPNDLVTIDEEYGDSTRMIKKDVYEAFRKMYDVAKLDGISLWITSAYRTPTYQKWLYNRSVKKKGVAQTNRDTALPGYSEHQTGLAIDVVQTRGKLLKGFEKTKQFEWLFAHSYEYGFILRYPKDKENITGYTYEPWHYRYVGTETAKKIKELNFTFDEYYEQFVNNQ